MEQGKTGRNSEERGKKLAMNQEMCWGAQHQVV
jgi:hypothetical protein